MHSAMTNMWAGIRTGFFDKAGLGTAYCAEPRFVTHPGHKIYIGKTRQSAETGKNWYNGAESFTCFFYVNII